MKLFLSSYRFGGHADAFVALTGRPAELAVIANASDAWPAAARASSIRSEFGPLRDLGYRPAELDLREYAGKPVEFERALEGFGAVWVRGGNTFVLRAQLARSGADEILSERVRNGSIVYGGYSAGACVAAPSLIGVEDADDPGEVRTATGTDAVWTGLGLVDFSIVPHLDSVLDEHSSSRATLQRLRADKIACHGLTDKQAIVIDEVGMRVLD